jgi:6-pyruvoyltetrahydropterin/6-carboxytetrahydropterin synthase
VSVLSPFTTTTSVLSGGEHCKGDGMYRLRIESHFDAAHKLIGYKGKCAELHGHTWKVEVFVVGEKLGDVGILVDFNILEEKMRKIIERLDHKFLNNIKEIGNPTCENLSKYIFETLKDLPKNITLERVRVWEGEKSWCEYYEA